MTTTNNPHGRPPDPRGRQPGTSVPDVASELRRLMPRDRWLLDLLHQHQVFTTEQVAALGFDNVHTARRRAPGRVSGPGAPGHPRSAAAERNPRGSPARRPAGVSRWVGAHGKVSLGGFSYHVGATYAGEPVEVVAAGGLVEVLHAGVVAATHAQRTREDH